MEPLQRVHGFKVWVMVRAFRPKEAFDPTAAMLQLNYILPVVLLLHLVHVVPYLRQLVLYSSSSTYEYIETLTAVRSYIVRVRRSTKPLSLSRFGTRLHAPVVRTPTAHLTINPSLRIHCVKMALALSSMCVDIKYDVRTSIGIVCSCSFGTGRGFQRTAVFVERVFFHIQACGDTDSLSLSLPPPPYIAPERIKKGSEMFIVFRVISMRFVFPMIRQLTIPLCHTRTGAPRSQRRRLFFLVDQGRVRGGQRDVPG